MLASLAVLSGCSLTTSAQRKSIALRPIIAAADRMAGAGRIDASYVDDIGWIVSGRRFRTRDVALVTINRDGSTSKIVKSYASGISAGANGRLMATGTDETRVVPSAGGALVEYVRSTVEPNRGWARLKKVDDHRILITAPYIDSPTRVLQILDAAHGTVLSKTRRGNGVLWVLRLDLAATARAEHGWVSPRDLSAVDDLGPSSVQVSVEIGPTGTIESFRWDGTDDTRRVKRRIRSSVVFHTFARMRPIETP